MNIETRVTIGAMARTQARHVVDMYTPAELRRARIVYNGACLAGVAAAIVAMAAIALAAPAFVLASALFGIGIVILLLVFLPDPSPAPPGNWAALQKLVATVDAGRSTLAVWASTNTRLTRADVRRFKRFCKRQAAEVAAQGELKDDDEARKSAARG